MYTVALSDGYIVIPDKESERPFDKAKITAGKNHPDVDRSSTGVNIHSHTPEYRGGRLYKSKWLPAALYHDINAMLDRGAEPSIEELS